MQIPHRRRCCGQETGWQANCILSCCTTEQRSFGAPFLPHLTMHVPEVGDEWLRRLQDAEKHAIEMTTSDKRWHDLPNHISCNKVLYASLDAHGAFYWYLSLWRYISKRLGDDGLAQINPAHVSLPLPFSPRPDAEDDADKKMALLPEKALTKVARNISTGYPVKRSNLKSLPLNSPFSLAQAAFSCFRSTPR